ncbi:hypothetical protein K438DRAFT_2077953 [Mycena galopus ATCC 62051]|nr:hypothetical protein K438DRAFT_2077953 [Mycena galopus ATCC 62051]
MSGWSLGKRRDTHHKEEKRPLGFCNAAIRILHLPPSSEVEPQAHFIQTDFQRFGKEAREAGIHGQGNVDGELRHRPVERVKHQIALEHGLTPQFVRPSGGQDVVENGEDQRFNVPRKRQTGWTVRQETRGLCRDIQTAKYRAQTVSGVTVEGQVWGIQKEVQARIPSNSEIVEDRRHEGGKREECCGGRGKGREFRQGYRVAE